MDALSGKAGGDNFTAEVDARTNETLFRLRSTRESPFVPPCALSTLLHAFRLFM